MTKFVIVDKSYLQGAPKTTIAEIASTQGLLMSEALLYELVKAESTKRAKWFAKFPDKAHPFELVPNPGKLLRTEIYENRSCGLPSGYVRPIDHGNTRLYRDPDYIIPEALSNVREDKRIDIQRDVCCLVRMARRDIPKLFSELKSGHLADRETLRERAELKICHDVDFVREKVTPLIMQSPYRVKNSLPLIDNTWITFRWFQVNLLFALELWSKYPLSIRRSGGEKLKERLRHDALDAQYLILGLLEGAFASNETKLCRWWAMLNPGGKLYRVHVAERGETSRM